jgi:hypothetical protein
MLGEESLSIRSTCGPRRRYCATASYQLLDDLDQNTMAIEEEDCTTTLFRTQVVRFKLLNYLQYKLPKQRSGLMRCETPTLLTAAFSGYQKRDLVGEDMGDKNDWPRNTIETLCCLLKSGQDPNRKCYDDQLDTIKPVTTPWAIILRKMIVRPTNWPVMADSFLSGLERGIFTRDPNRSDDRLTGADIRYTNGSRSDRMSSYHPVPLIGRIFWLLRGSGTNRKVMLTVGSDKRIPADYRLTVVDTCG